MQSDLDVKDQQARDLKKQMARVEERIEDEKAVLLEELDQAQEEIQKLQQNEAKHLVYKKKADELVVIKVELREVKEDRDRMQDSL